MLNDGSRIVRGVNSYVATVRGGLNDVHVPGGRQAHVHLVRFLVGDLTRGDYMRIVSEAITIAVLFDPHTGGHIETCAFGQTPTCNFGYLVKEKRHAMKNLALYFTVIEEAGHLDNCLIFMTEGLLYTRLAERVSAEKIGIIVRDAESIEYKHSWC